jgi:hypothetical protein
VRHYGIHLSQCCSDTVIILSNTEKENTKTQTSKELKGRKLGNLEEEIKEFYYIFLLLPYFVKQKNSTS